ncbi:C40 family peptidase [Desulfitobacterium sp.]|uniref:C40 family peptidase n=1 Tax=Desulfitobacterium sp. TaxID=49981 RepID=UPI002B893300|nr:C40 family peptidase [Desulfitobacterium sp.]HVJ47710.1 C40 family peptidase [Desulfitobacterium sp.]
MSTAQTKWVSVLTLSGMVWVLGLSVQTVPSQAFVKQQESVQSLNRSETQISSMFVKDNISEQTKTPENRLQSEEPEKKSNPTQVASQIEEESPSKVINRTDTKNVSVASSSTEPKASSQVSRGSSEVDNLIKRATSLQGIPYLWGGTTRAGFDCSGFVQYVFKASGVSLPRSSFEQYKVGTPVSRDQLKPGDLVFFSTYNSGASDVRIYIGGGRTIGSARDGVAIHSLSESYWSSRYVGARRIL